jgi:hypothetical protein
MQLVNDADCAEVDDVVTRFTDGARLMPKLVRPRFVWSRMNPAAGVNTIAHEWVKNAPVHDEHGGGAGDGQQDDNGVGCPACHGGVGHSDPTRIAPPFAPLDAPRQQSAGDGLGGGTAPGHLTAAQVRMMPTGAEHGSSMLVVDAAHFLEVYADARLASAAAPGAEFTDPSYWVSPHDNVDAHVRYVFGDALDKNIAETPDAVGGGDTRVAWREWQWRLFSSVTVVGAVDGSSEVAAAGLESFLLRFAHDVCPTTTNDTTSAACAVDVGPLRRRARAMAARYGHGALTDPHVKAYATVLARAILEHRGYAEARTVSAGGGMKAIIFTKIPSP